MKLIGEHIDRCTHLGLSWGDHRGVPTLFKHISQSSVPLMRSIHLTSLAGDARQMPAHSSANALPLPALSNIIHVTKIQLHGREYLPLLSTMPSLKHITSLEVFGLPADEKNISALQNILLAMNSLVHFGFGTESFESPAVSLSLPTVRYLNVDRRQLHMLHAPLVITLLCNLFEELDFDSGIDIEENLRAQYPSLKHLIILDDGQNYGPDYHELAASFPNIERLTYYYIPKRGSSIWRFDEIFTDIMEGAELSSFGWRRLNTIALSGYSKAEHGFPQLKEILHKLQAAPYSLKTFILPAGWADDQVFAGLDNIIEVQDFDLDWPQPFTKSILNRRCV